MKLFRQRIDAALPRRQAEQMAVEMIVRLHIGEGFSIAHDGAGAPYIEGYAPLSVSHCRDEAVIAVSDDDRPIGVDIETEREQLERVRLKFLTEDEVNTFASLHDLLRAWTAKEAVYKAALTPGLALDEIRLELTSCGMRASARGQVYDVTYPLDSQGKVIAVAQLSACSSVSEE
ncbi:MAG: 4'-phosphopantetheinyl transferase superfamily protein [Lachnoclostridium sp.]|nr:4'-phosphopantetheinyl transferase superfamily protein [Lachnoclostridium sp.]